MNEHIDPTEIRSIISNTPITIRFNDGSKIIANGFVFTGLEHYVSREDEAWEVNVKDDL